MASISQKLSPIQLLVLSFGVLIVLGTILLSLPFSHEHGKDLSLIDAVFTSTSAVCVTGLIVVDTPQTFSTFGEIVIMLLIQLGGIGIVTFATVFIILMGHQVSFRNRLILREHFSLGGVGYVLSLAWKIIKLTLAFELIGAAYLTYLFMRDYAPVYSAYLAIFHSISAFCNAGFSLFSNSLENYPHDLMINLTFMSLIITGGLGFPVLTEILTWKKGRILSVQTRVVLWTSVILIAAGAVIIHVFSSRHGFPGYVSLSGTDKFLVCLFQSVTARTAGFNTLDLNAFPGIALMLIIILMFIGGSPQSTAGGIKTTTFWVIIIGTWNYLRGEKSIRAWHRNIKSETHNRAVALFFTAFVLVITAAGCMVYQNPTESFKLFFETVSAFGTVGLSLGATGELNSIQKLIIIFLMFIGRVGPISFAFFFITKRMSRIDYPEIDIPIG